MPEPAKTYADSGVDYSSVDPIKVLAQKRAGDTAANLASFSSQEMTASRGESAYVWDAGDCYRSLVIEGLGTKNLVADAVRPLTGKTHYDAIAQDAIAMIVNDLIVVGAMPEVINAYFAVGDADWMRDEQRASDLINGWGNACQAIGATWGGGETPMLKNVIVPGTIDIGGAATGVIKNKSQLVLGDKLAAGDSIVLVESSGIHANGITFVRSLAEKDPDIYKAQLPGGRTFGEALVTPTHLYVELVRQMQKSNLDLHYMVNITGHGWRKLMRASLDFSYVIDNVPEPQAEFAFMQEKSGATTQEMYGNFNMGAGFAIYVPSDQAQQVVDLAGQQNLKAWIAGRVENGPKQVVIQPVDVTFSEDTLEVRS
ncbi:MAG TPA: AIR synthase-related protein [Candidatus Saccharimonadales bacterium]|nr:AIR synthase-related protein [Candidatus Saccharimonadales bacterium]